MIFTEGTWVSLSDKFPGFLCYLSATVMSMKGVPLQEADDQNGILEKKKNQSRHGTRIVDPLAQRDRLCELGDLYGR